MVQVVSALWRGSWQNFNWHDASHGPSVIAELLVVYGFQNLITVNFYDKGVLWPKLCWWHYLILPSETTLVWGYLEIKRNLLLLVGYAISFCWEFVQQNSVLWRCWLGGRKSIRPVKNRVVVYWRGCLSAARCRFAYGPADATATHCLLLQ